MTHLLISYGFVPDVKNFNSKNNWFGLSVYHPDVVFKKDNRRVVLSLNGCNVPLSIDIYCKYKELFDTRSVKYIKFVKDSTIIHESFTGTWPSVDVFKEFIS